MKEKNKGKVKEELLPISQQKVINLRVLVIVWASVLSLTIVVYFLSQSIKGDFLKSSTYQMINIIVSFSSFVVTSLFSTAIFNHNKTIRGVNERNQRINDDQNARGEAFRTLQFVSANYTVVDFVDHMLIYEVYDSYRNKLRNEKDLKLYMRENNINSNDIFENFDDYQILTVRIPFKIVEGKPVNMLRFSKIEYVKEGGRHIFVPCSGANRSLIIYNENDKRSEAIVNIITRKDSEFYTASQVVPFLKIKLDISIQSLLGVTVNGRVELYFTNPTKLEKSGANKYKIESSQFKISGLPTLLNAVGDDIKNI